MERGTIIVLNGASSSGKTSIVRAFQDVMEEPVLAAGLDRFLWMLPRRYHSPPLWDDVLGLATAAGPVGHRLVSGMHVAIAALSARGNHIAADHVLVEPAWIQECAELFAGLPAYLIAVRCPLEVLERREQERKDRTPGQARAQFDLVHAHGLYDFEVDTSELSSEECAQAIKQRITDGPSPMAFSSLRSPR